MSEQEDTAIDQIKPGDHINIRDGTYRVSSLHERAVDHQWVLIGFHVMSIEPDDTLTDGTISRLRVEDEPYELDVCNGPVHEIAPEEVGRDA